MADLDDYGPFDAGIGANRTEDFWRDFFRHLTGSGVIDGVGSEMAVSERGAGANMSVDVATGECYMRGHWGEATATKNLPIATADPTNPRIDRVVLRLDVTANKITLEVLEGTPAGSPSAPSLTQTSSIWEVSLARVSVPAADTTIGNAQITDERTILTLGPASSGLQVVGSGQRSGAAQTGIGTSLTDLTGITTGSVPVTETTVWVIGYVTVEKKTSAGFVQLELVEDSTAFPELSSTALASNVGTNELVTIPFVVRHTTTVGSHTFKVQARASTDTCDVYDGAIQVTA